MHHRYLELLLLSLILLSIYSCKNTPAVNANNSAKFEKELQEKLATAKEGDVIDLPEGKYNLERPLVLDGVKNVTIKGKGTDKTILSFKDQKDGAEGLRITANGVILEDFCIMDAKGDCIKVLDGMNVTMRRIKSGWTASHSKQNGSYGIYPVGCTNVLIEDCEVIGASDAGIYVGQSKNIIVRKNRVHDNVAGIEIENCTDADVYENASFNNTGGLLVFDLPELPVKNGMRCRVHNNKIYDNNTVNFGPKGTAVSKIPAGTGIIIMATNQCDIYSNEIINHNTVSMGIISYLTMQTLYKDSIYDPYCGGICIRDNVLRRGTGIVDLSVDFGKLFKGIFGDKVPDIVYDGKVNPAYRNNDGTIKDDQKICIRNNGSATFARIDMASSPPKIDRNLNTMDCTLSAWPEVKLVQ